MAVEIPKRGTRGSNAPPRALLRAAMRVATPIHRLRGDKGPGGNLLYLTTVGARSGKRRTLPLAYFPDGENAWLIVASFGGAADHPAWFYNIARNPDQVEIEVGGRKLRVTPQTLTGALRSEAFARIAAQRPQYAGYQENTDREIPVVRLTPAEPEPAPAADDG